MIVTLYSIVISPILEPSNSWFCIAVYVVLGTSYIQSNKPTELPPKAARGSILFGIPLAKTISNTISSPNTNGNIELPVFPTLNDNSPIPLNSNGNKGAGLTIPWFTNGFQL